MSDAGKGRVAGGVAFVLAFIAMRYVVPEVARAWRERTPQGRIIGRALADLSPADSATFFGYLREHNIRDDAEGEREGARLAALGMVRLSDDVLIRRAVIFRRLMDGVPTEDCAAVVRGGFQGLGREKMLAIVSDTAEFEWFTRVGFQAILAEIRHEGRGSVSDAEARQAMQFALATMSEEDAAHALRIAPALASASPDDQCWLLRRMYRAVTELPSPADALLARTLVSQDQPAASP